MADRISNLPDSLLHHILSFLPVNYVVATSILAKRWRYLWLSTPTLNFDATELQDESNILKLISLALMLYEGQKIQKFHVRLNLGNVEDCYVVSWIRFAMRHHVEELNLEFSHTLYDPYVTEENGNFVLPRCLFNCLALKVLSLSGQLNIPSTFSFHSLKKFKLCLVELTDLDSSGCPLLEDLDMLDCNLAGCLKIYSPNLRLRNMKICDSFSDVCVADTELEIHAPHLLSLENSGFMQRNYKIKKLLSIKEVSFDFSDMLSPSNFDSDDC